MAQLIRLENQKQYKSSQSLLQIRQSISYPQTVHFCSLSWQPYAKTLEM